MEKERLKKEKESVIIPKDDRNGPDLKGRTKEMKIDYSKIIRMKLLEEMKTGIFSECNKLPRELELAEHFGVSRNHLRSVLTELEQEGFITRIHGIGTMINRHVMSVKNRMDIEVEFLDIIRQNGYHPDLTFIDFQEEKASPYLAGKLGISEGEEILKVSRVLSADGRPAIYCEDYFDKKLIREAYTMKDFELPIFHFIKKCCYLEAHLDLTQLRAALVDEKLSNHLNLEIGSPILNMEEVDYDLYGNIVFYSSQYFVGEFFEQTVLRKKL